MTARQPRVLLIAEACNPEWTSVPLVGFRLYKALQHVADITLVTQIRNKPALLRHAPENEKVHFIDSELLARPFARLGTLLTLGRGVGWTTKQAVGWLPYLYFEHLVRKRFQRHLEAGIYDIIHRITPLTPTYPSPIVGHTSVPFIVGPINGGLPWPKGTTRVRLAEAEWLSYCRNAHRLLPYFRRTYRKAACIIAGSRYTLSSLPPEALARSTYIPENGIDPDCFNANNRPLPSRVRPFRVLFAGRLVPYKGASLVLDAIASSQILRRTAELVIAGDGPERFRLETAAEARGMREHTRFLGAIEQPRLVEHYRNASVFAFPSLREFGGAVVMEAMACGLPCIVADHGGPAEYVTEETGIRLPVGSRSEMVSAMTSALERLALNGDLLDDMSSAGIARARACYTWQVKANQIRELYDRVLGGQRPENTFLR